MECGLLSAELQLRVDASDGQYINGILDLDIGIAYYLFNNNGND